MKFNLRCHHYQQGSKDSKPLRMILRLIRKPQQQHYSSINNMAKLERDTIARCSYPYFERLKLKMNFEK